MNRIKHSHTNRFTDKLVTRSGGVKSSVPRTGQNEWLFRDYGRVIRTVYLLGVIYK